MESEIDEIFADYLDESSEKDSDPALITEIAEKIAEHVKFLYKPDRKIDQVNNLPLLKHGFTFQVNSDSLDFLDQLDQYKYSTPVESHFAFIIENWLNENFNLPKDIDAADEDYEQLILFTCEDVDIEVNLKKMTFSVIFSASITIF